MSGSLPEVKETKELIIFSMPDVDEHRYQQFTEALLKTFQGPVDRPIIVTRSKIQAVTKEDILDLKTKIDYVCEQNGWIH